MDDTELLHDYAADRSEAAFRSLVERYVALVYSAALRQVENPTLAEDVTQAVFILLSRKAGQIPETAVLAGWLYRTTHHLATRALRTEWRRQRREREALQLQVGDSGTGWDDRLASCLDAAMEQLGSKDRDAVLLRYFRNRSLREVGFALGLSEDAAQKRVSRALGKLRQFLAKRGVAASDAALMGLLPTHAAQLAPPHLAGTVLASVLSKSGLPTSVYALVLGGASRLPLWPKVVKLALRAAGGMGCATAVLLIVHFWPRKPANTSGVSFEARLVTHPRPAAQPASPSIADVARKPPASPPPADPAPVEPQYMLPALPLAEANPVSNVVTSQQRLGEIVTSGIQARSLKMASPQSNFDQPTADGSALPITTYQPIYRINQVVWMLPLRMTNRGSWAPSPARAAAAPSAPKSPSARNRSGL